MRKLTDGYLAQIIGSSIQGYHIEAAKIKTGPFADSDHYGILLGKNSRDMYVTWEFHLMGDGAVSAYWGHYIDDREEAFRDFNARAGASPQWFDVTITEELKLVIRLEAGSKQEAERIVADDWMRQEYVLGPEHFAGVEFEAVATAKNREDMN